MPPRYTVRRDFGEDRYSVWDNANDRPATSADRECTDLSFDEAFQVADALNRHASQPKAE